MRWLPLALCVVVLCSFAQSSLGQETDIAKLREETVAMGLAYLRDHGQAEDGMFMAEMGPGITAMALSAAMRNGLGADDPMVAKGLAALEKFVKPDGGIYGTGRIKNYETCVAIVTFRLANKDKKYDGLLANAEKFVRGLQFGVLPGQEKSNPNYGGVGYSGSERPDLSNTSYLMDALVELGASGDDAAIQRALVFVGRCQNLKSEYNDTKFADKVNDGGFYYVIPTESVDSSTDERYTDNGGLRSYGSMSYAGFKSLIYAGLTKEDPRVKAVLDWLGKNYSVTENPGVGDAGLFYYYNSFAAALDAAKMGKLADTDGKAHDWRGDLVKELAKRQNADGSWTNENRQWFENDPNLATSFALIALSYCGEDRLEP
jgi:squalene-hopene/tetraprenyl-beta-curcumene cyclase